jgi:hypothetical protein
MMGWRCHRRYVEGFRSLIREPTISVMCTLDGPDSTSHGLTFEL